MKLPRMTAGVGGGGPSAAGWTALPKTAGRTGITPATTLAQRNQAQQFINNNCHNLRRCNGTEGCDTFRQRGLLANDCTSARFTVRSYYLATGDPDPGDHQGALVWDDAVAQSCLLAATQQNCP